MERMTRVQQLQIAKAVQTICIETAIRAYEDAGLGGLCQEGRWERALDAMQGVNLPAWLAVYVEAPHD